MDEEIIEALLKSTEKWIEISHNLKHDAGTSDCELCKLFNTYESDECEGCPIKEESGEQSCERTPFEKWYNHQYDDHHHSYYKDEYRVGDCRQCKQIALEECLFIYSLLPYPDSVMTEFKNY